MRWAWKMNWTLAHGNLGGRMWHEKRQEAQERLQKSFKRLHLFKNTKMNSAVPHLMVANVEDLFPVSGFNITKMRQTFFSRSEMMTCALPG